MTAASDQPLVLAVPSKGRLQENAAAFFARSGLSLVQARGARDYRGAVQGLPDVEVAYLSASDIVTQIAQGSVHLGVTGADLVHEQVPENADVAELIAPLGFGHANVVVAVPQAWIDVHSMADLDDVAADLRLRSHRKLRVATKYINLTRRFFAAAGLSDYRIVESLGATEGAPAAGAAEVVVDITTTGATLAANGLKVLGDGLILASEAHLVASRAASWSPAARRAARAILARIAAQDEAQRLREVRARLSEAAAAAIEAAAAPHGARLAFGPPGADGVVTLHCPLGSVFALVDALLGQGAQEVTVRAIDYLFRPENPLAERLFARL